MPSVASFPTVREVSIDGPAFVRDIVTIPLSGPTASLANDGTRQEFLIDLSPSKVILSPDFKPFDFAVFFGDIAEANNSQFFPPDPLDTLVLTGTNLGMTAQDASLQEYLKNSTGPVDETVALAFFARDDTLDNPTQAGEITTLRYTLDIPSSLVNDPVVDLASPVLRVLARKTVPSSEVNSLPPGVKFVPEPNTLLLGAVAVILLFGLSSVSNRV